MNEKLETAIANVLAMVRPNIKADDAMKFTQSALNLAHVKSLLETKTAKKQGADAA